MQASDFVTAFGFFVKVKLCIFRTDNGRGWGLKAGEKIERGAFLTTYLGEIITSEEAAIRDDNYGEINIISDIPLIGEDSNMQHLNTFSRKNRIIVSV